MSKIHEHVVKQFSNEELDRALGLVKDETVIANAEQMVGLGSIAVRFLHEHQGQNLDLKLYIVGLCLLLVSLPAGDEKKELRERLAATVQSLYDASVFGRSEVIASLVVSLS